MKKIYIISAVAVAVVLVAILAFVYAGSADKTQDSEAVNKEVLKENIVNTKRIKGKHQLKLETNKEVIRQILMKRKQEMEAKSEKKDETFDPKPADKK